MNNNITPSQAIFNTLEPELRKHLAGGVVMQIISRQTTPSVFDINRELLPCALFRVISNTPIAPLAYSQLNFALYLYQINHTDLISNACQVLYSLLHRKNVCGFPVYHQSDTYNLVDDVLKANLIITRYEYCHIRSL